MSRAKRAGPPLARHLRAQSCEDVSGETGRTTSRTASQSSEFRGRLRRNLPDHLSRGISELRVWRMSQAKRVGPPLARHLRAQSLEDAQAKRAEPPRKRHLGAQSCEDVSGETGRTTSRTAPRGS
eukprot:3052317-Pyramimonas_sp.AAC.1